MKDFSTLTLVKELMKRNPKLIAELAVSARRSYNFKAASRNTGIRLISFTMKIPIAFSCCLCVTKDSGNFFVSSLLSHLLLNNPHWDLCFYGK